MGSKVIPSVTEIGAVVVGEGNEGRMGEREAVGTPGRSVEGVALEMVSFVVVVVAVSSASSPRVSVVAGVAVVLVVVNVLVVRAVREIQRQRCQHAFPVVSPILAMVGWSISYFIFVSLSNVHLHMAT